MSYPNIKLVSFSMCAYVQRARIVLEEKSIPHEIEYIDLNMPPDWFYDVSPLEKVPVLLVDDQPLFESMVICDYLDDISEGSLYPEDAFARAQQRSWIGFGDGVLGTVYDLLNATSETDFKRAKATIIDRLDVLEEELDIQHFFAGQQFGMVDASIAPLFRFLDGIRRLTDMDFFEDTPSIKDWSDRVLAHPAVKQSVPEDYETQLKVYLAKPDTILKNLLK